MILHFKGHPVHTILAHFPSALFPTGMIFDFAGLYFNEPSLFTAAFYCQSAGLITGVFVLLSGLTDVYGLYQRNDQVAMKIALLHGGINSLVMMTYFVILYLRMKDYPHFSGVPVWFLVSESTAVLLLIVGNFYGGETYQKVIKNYLKGG